MSNASPNHAVGPAQPDLMVSVTPTAAHVVVHVTGEIDISTCERLRDSIGAWMGARQRIVLDLSEVTFLDSSFLSVLLNAHTSLTEDGGSLVLQNPSSAALRLLAVAGVEGLLEVQIG